MRLQLFQHMSHVCEVQAQLSLQGRAGHGATTRLPSVKASKQHHDNFIRCCGCAKRAPMSASKLLSFKVVSVKRWRTLSAVKGLRDVWGCVRQGWARRALSCAHGESVSAATAAVI